MEATLQARILEWLPFPFPGDLPDPEIEPGSLSRYNKIFIPSKEENHPKLKYLFFLYSGNPRDKGASTSVSFLTLHPIRAQGGSNKC